MADKTIIQLPLASFIGTTDVSVLVSNNVDYQFDFALLLQFISANISTGAAITFGTAIPQNNSGKNGDVFFKTDAPAFYQKTNGSWAQVYALATSTISGNALLYGEGIPGSTIGADNDSYINTTTGIFYLRTSGTWSQVFSMATGPQGPQGTAGTNGTNGTNGNTLLSGTTNPSNTNGNNGDYYINLSTYALFGPKTSGTWGTGVSLIGDTGPAGPQGIAGAAGTNGVAGVTGATGPGVVSGGAAGQVLSKIDSTDYNTQWINPPATGAPAANGILTGLALTVTSSVLSIAAGTWRISGIVYQTTTATNITLAAADSVNNRIDLIYANTSDAILVLEGSPSANPVKPSLPPSCVEVGFALVSPAGTTTGSAPSADYVTSATFNSVIGDKTTLVTDNKNNLVEAINAIANKAGTSIPAVTDGTERTVTQKNDGTHIDYELIDQVVSASTLSSADFSSGIAAVNGLQGQLAYDTNYKYECIGINQWIRYVIDNNLIDLYLADIDDTAEDKTSAELQLLYPASLTGQQVWGVNKLYIKKTSTGWKKITIGDA
jgi:hypothetical protein